MLEHPWQASIRHEELHLVVLNPLNTEELLESKLTDGSREMVDHGTWALLQHPRCKTY